MTGPGACTRAVAFREAEGRMDDAAGQLPVLAVLGGSRATQQECEVAAAVGRLAAERGWVVLTGGGPGVMGAASRGAFEAGGLTLAILPGAGPSPGYPNRWVRLPVYTGAGHARNVFNVLTARLCVAVGGSAGTLSEIALALKAGVEVWSFAGWRLDPPASSLAIRPRMFEERGELLRALEAVLASGGGEGGSRAVSSEL